MAMVGAIDRLKKRSVKDDKARTVIFVFTRRCRFIGMGIEEKEFKLIRLQTRE